MKQRVQDLVKLAEKQFDKRMPFVQLCQELAEHFYPERADFTASHCLGKEFASGLVTAAPVLARRDLANQLQAMLRPRGGDWLGLTPEDERLAEDAKVVEFSKWLVDRQRRFMDDYRSCFSRVMKQGDNDFITFGQAVLSVEPNMLDNTLLYRSWHIRDVAWLENYAGVIDQIFRRWNPEARQLVREYRDKVHQSVSDCVARNEGDKEIKCQHIVLPYDEYDHSAARGQRGRYRFVQIAVDIENQHILSETPVEDHPYIIPRWQLAGSQYAMSPAAHYALPDARTLQAISYTLLKAGELAVDPPLVAVDEQIRSDINIRPGGVTWVESDYDERLGEILRPLNQDRTGLQFGLEMSQRVLAMIHEAFLLNKINLPPMSADMTATEVQIRTQEYIRNALPLFEPLETEYNGPLADKTFGILLKMGAFGRPEDWPQQMRNMDLKFTFESPLLDASRKQDSARFMEAANLLAVAAQIDPALKDEWDYREHFRKAMLGLQAPMVDESEAREMQEAGNEMLAAQQTMGLLSQGAQVAQQVGAAGQQINELAAQNRMVA